MTGGANSAHPHLPGRLAPADLADVPATWPVDSSVTHFDSSYLQMRVDTIVSPVGERLSRAVVQPRGAVGVLAVDPEGRIMLVEQFRHAVGHRMIELPAGILDVEDESPQVGAARELAEEADLVAEHWEPLLTTRSSPGYTSETLLVFRATGLSGVAEADRTVREGEEADMLQWWVDLDDAVDAVLAMRITNGLTVAAILAEKVRRSR
ncbi:hydrolase, NUDIX family [Aeromicrobium marinum DSM 15272]|uniref:Hydrolase, NUDIX family n=1 Tax=Aeromicrobium marinum DSM 15272 TaxID=585531 RepID=E2S9M2_9ACTN|nr:NUDIX hydrolase [Aeromicrobium marinum]EFQ83946.1 hydrolase, NUDIX family [Aeromicrobium marinum DSM 15272]